MEWHSLRALRSLRTILKETFLSPQHPLPPSSMSELTQTCSCSAPRSDAAVQTEQRSSAELSRELMLRERGARCPKIADQILMLLSEFDGLGGVGVARCASVCTAWRNIFGDGSDRRWLGLCALDFRIPRSPCGTSLLLNGPHPSTTPSPDRPPHWVGASPFQVGNPVYARYPDGRWYEAVVSNVAMEGGEFVYIVDWEDGDPNHRVKKAEEMRADGTAPPPSAGEAPPFDPEAGGGSRVTASFTSTCTGTGGGWQTG